MGYYQVDVIVDGALDQTEDCTLGRYRQLKQEVEQEAAQDGLPTELFAIYHAHQKSIQDCECQQFVMNRNPRYTWNLEES